MKKLISLAILLTAAISASAQKSGDKETITVNGVSFNMIFVEGGVYIKADPEQQTEVSVGDFYICQTEVTQSLWKAVMKKNPSYCKGNDLPVENVSWQLCNEFIAKLNQITGRHFSLPTEAEWEYAARGGNKSKEFKFSGDNMMSKCGWYKGNSNEKSHPVATKTANELGLFDMSGNVWEWCADKYDNNDDNLKYRAMRGGCFNSTSQLCWIWNRYKGAENSGYDKCGLRLVMH